MSAKRAAGGLESEVLAALWAGDAAMTTAEVVESLGGELAYNTVQTILTRLLGKGAVRREAAGRAHVYSPVLDDAGLVANRMRALLDKESDRTAVLHHFVGSLKPEEEALIEQLLRAHRHPEGDD